MSKLYSVDDIASRLNMHQKTVQRYIREGKIKASKVGKSWRVTEEDFKAYMASNGLTLNVLPSPSNAFDKVKVSSVVDIDVVDTQEAISIANTLTATLNTPHEFGKTSMNIQFIEEENKVRIMLWGNVKFTEHMMGFIADYICQQ